MIRIQEAIVVEGRYDVNTIRQLVDTVVLETGGFRIFSDQERLAMIRRIAAVRGILILTDSDGAGFVIRNFLRGAVPQDQVKHAYIPDILGKERRKRKGSAEGKLGVEGMPQEILLRSLRQAGATFLEGDTPIAGPQALHPQIIKADLYALGLSGTQNSNYRRKALLRKMELPEHLSSNALLDFLNAVSNLDEVKKYLCEIDNTALTGEA
ncbi:DUF4093 domain-containing protein [Intestinibacillus massiliensis]|uniref:toprim domain-containing protein n=1 Tax=Intestinibacillus massiliensis TaxID=1871029 RepID=UPI000B350691|nr:DUF4093 domain-containing protein [Intestinibacillus massiliensis]MCB6366976.1 DUF4093 domain-containing protein [Intestinibacillus massiliensis]